MNEIDLKGQHAVVTGGAQGIGFAIAKRLISSGAKATLWDMDGEALDGATWALGGAARDPRRRHRPGRGRRRVEAQRGR